MFMLSSTIEWSYLANIRHECGQMFFFMTNACHRSQHKHHPEISVNRYVDDGVSNERHHNNSASTNIIINIYYLLLHLVIIIYT